MRQKSVHPESPSDRTVKNIRRATRKHYSAEEKIRIVLDGLQGECSIAELCRREGISESLYYTWSKEFLEAGKRRLAGDTARAALRGSWIRSGIPFWCWIRICVSSLQTRLFVRRSG
jgi:transposase